MIFSRHFEKKHDSYTVASFFVSSSDLPTFTENRWSANIIHTEKTIWPSQHAIFNLMLYSKLRWGKYCAISELHCALLGRRPRFKKALPRDQHAISEHLTLFGSKLRSTKDVEVQNFVLYSILRSHVFETLGFLMFRVRCDFWEKSFNQRVP